MNRADLLAADLEEAVQEVVQRSGGASSRFLDRLSRLSRLGAPEYRSLVTVATGIRDDLGGRLGTSALRELDVAALEARTARVAVDGEPNRAFDVGLDVLMLVEIAPWLPIRVDAEPILAWWDAMPASFLTLPELAASRRHHDRHAPPRVNRVLSRMSAIALAVLEEVD